MLLKKKSNFCKEKFEFKQDPPIGYNKMVTIQDVRLRHERMSTMNAFWVTFVLGNFFSFSFAITNTFSYLLLPAFTLLTFNFFYVQEIYHRYNWKKGFLVMAGLFFVVGWFHSRYYIRLYREEIASPIILYSILPQLFLLYTNYISFEPLYLKLYRPITEQENLEPVLWKCRGGMRGAYLAMIFFMLCIFAWSNFSFIFRYYLKFSDRFSVISLMHVISILMTYMNFKADMFEISWFLFLPITPWIS